MIQLTLQWVKTYAGSDRKFRAGFMLHQHNTIQTIEATSKNGFRVELTDLDHIPYELTLYFYPDTGTFKYAKCTCHDTQPCSHTIGALLYILYKKESLAVDLVHNQTLKMYESFEKVLSHSMPQSQMQHLNLEVCLHPKDAFHPNIQTSISLKVGLYQVYVVRQIEAFVQAVIEGKPYELSKNFTYDPTFFSFTPENKKILELLYDFYQTRLHLLPGRQALVTTPIKASFQSLPSTYIKRLMDLLKGRLFNLDFDGLLFKNQEVLDQVEVDFYVSTEPNHYSVSVNTYDVFFPLTEDFNYVFYNNQISYLNPQKSNAFKLFYHYFADKIVDIDVEQLDDFVNRILPVLQMIGYVTMDASITDRIISHPILPKIYIDKLGDSLALRVIYLYGPYEISKYPEGDVETSDFILSRHLDIEQQIHSALHSVTTTVLEDGRLTYPTEDNMFYFMDRILPRLQNLSEVFYSDDFKATYLKSKKQLTTSITYHSDLNLLDLNFEMEGISRQEINELFQAIIEKKHYFKLSDGSFFAINDDLTEEMRALNQRYPVNTDKEDAAFLQVSGHHAFYLDTLVNHDLPGVHYNDSYQKLLSAIRNPEDYHVETPPSLEPILRDYQKIGFKWLSALTSYGLGGILADDMGLGKTIQAITLMTSKDHHRPSLVVAPTSLLYNWEEEVHKFAPEQTTKVIAGSKLERNALIEEITQSDIVITSYGALKRDLPLYQHMFMYCIIDEAQHIKNPKSQNALAVKGIKALHRFALTGTPIENTLTELWSIFDFILPDFLGSHSYFVNTYERPIIKENDHLSLKQLSQMISPFILRRLKEDVLKELPPKIETKVSIELNKHQKKIYMGYVEQAKMELSTLGQMPVGQKNMKILSILTRLRQICCHPSLFIDNYEHSSSKMDLLLELVTDSIESGHRMLIFSQFTSMLNMIKDLLDKNKVESFYLDGSVPPNKRQQMVHDFNTGSHSVFLISLKAGGTGLNLTGADVVIHVDPWWNPAVENQATDRAYRIGQKKCVQVYKLITAGTIEEKIFALQQKKQGLIENVIQPGETFINKLSVNELQALFDL